MCTRAIRRRMQELFLKIIIMVEILSYFAEFTDVAPDAWPRSRVWNEQEDRWYGIFTSGCAHVYMHKHPADVSLNLNRLLWRVNFSLLSLLLVWQLCVPLIYTVCLHFFIWSIVYIYMVAVQLLFVYEGYPLQYVQPGLYTADGLSAFFSSADVFETQCPLSSTLLHLRSALSLSLGAKSLKG